tara:strand:- start:1687 stop:2289 length:603 start_codon:yes stop_codon:yes gene_type:complete
MLFSLFFLNSQSLQDARNDVFCEIGQLDSAAEISTLVESLGDSFTSYEDLFYKVPCINPLNPNNVKRISSEFSKRRFHPIDKKYKVHNGIDLSTSIGKTVHAAADGTVINIQYSKKGYGKNITIQHAYGYTTRYAHMALILVLKEGQKVKLGEPIGMVGSTGKSTGNHLHYEVKKEGVFLNPIGFFGLYSIISNSKINSK